MKSEVINILPKATRRKSKKYPYIGKNRTFGTIVLFTEPGTGVVLGVGASGWELGDFFTEWNEEYFSKFNDEVKVSN